MKKNRDNWFKFDKLIGDLELKSAQLVKLGALMAKLQVQSGPVHEELGMILWTGESKYLKHYASIPTHNLEFEPKDILWHTSVWGAALRLSIAGKSLSFHTYLDPRALSRKEEREGVVSRKPLAACVNVNGETVTYGHMSDPFGPLTMVMGGGNVNEADLVSFTDDKGAVRPGFVVDMPVSSFDTYCVTTLDGTELHNVKADCLTSIMWAEQYL